MRVSHRLVCSAMDQGSSTENGAVEKTASQLKKEAQRLAKLEKFNKKKEKEAALAENQTQVSEDVCIWLSFFWKVKITGELGLCVMYSLLI